MALNYFAHTYPGHIISHNPYLITHLNQLPTKTHLTPINLHLTHTQHSQQSSLHLHPVKTIILTINLLPWNASIKKTSLHSQTLIPYPLSSIRSKLIRTLQYNAISSHELHTLLIINLIGCDNGIVFCTEIRILSYHNAKS